MSTENDFKSSQDKVKGLKKRPSDQELLQLYALYKQGTEGDVHGDRPGMLAIKDRAKFDAWAKVKGKSKDAAQTEYVALVNTLIKKLG